MTAARGFAAARTYNLLVRPALLLVLAAVAFPDVALAETPDHDIGLAVVRLAATDQRSGPSEHTLTGVALQLSPLLRQAGWWRHATVDLRLAATIPPGDFSSAGRIGGAVGYYRDSPPVGRFVRFGLGASAFIEDFSIYRETEDPGARDGDGIALGASLRGTVRLSRFELHARYDLGRVVGDEEPLPINGSFRSLTIGVGAALF